MGDANKFQVLRLGIPDWLVPRWWKVAYLIVGPDGWLRKDLAKLIQIRPDERFEQFVKQQITAYVEKGELPAEPVAPAILNLADDVMAGREPTIRAGDYIAIQNHLRQAR